MSGIGNRESDLFIVYKIPYIYLQKCHITFKEMLTSVLKALIKNSVKKSFIGKEKKTINILTIFFISHKNDVKIFLK